MLQVVDISKKTEDITEQLFESSTNHGFLFVKGHGIPQSHIENLFKVSAEYFALDQSVKDKYPIENNIGYTSFNQEQLDARKTKDYKEAYNFGPINSTTGEIPIENHPEFFQKYNDLITKTNFYLFEVAKQLFVHLLKTLKIDKDKIPEIAKCLTGDTHTILRFLRYPQMRSLKEAENDDIRAGAHTDYGLLTILFQQEGQQGLQLNLNKEDDQDWLPIAFQPSDDISKEGAPLVVNFGDLLQFWTNGTIKSTIHRVVIPETRLKDRYSIVFFVHPQDKTSLEGWESKYIPKDEENKPQVNAYEHLLMRLNETYS
ncbi:hypothetical protein QEN19_001276 [Hanseniaspora menglaensis]